MKMKEVIKQRQEDWQGGSEQAMWTLTDSQQTKYNSSNIYARRSPRISQRSDREREREREKEIDTLFPR
jgi:hypothetical protein